MTYADAAGSVTVDLRYAVGYQNTGVMGLDWFMHVENLIGSAYNDASTGDANVNAHGAQGRRAQRRRRERHAGQRPGQRHPRRRGGPRYRHLRGRDGGSDGGPAYGLDKIDLRAVRHGASDAYAITTDGVDTVLIVDPDGNGTADMSIRIVGHTLTGADILWS